VCAPEVREEKRDAPNGIGKSLVSGGGGNKKGIEKRSKKRKIDFARSVNKTAPSGKFLREKKKREERQRGRKENYIEVCR